MKALLIALFVATTLLTACDRQPKQITVQDVENEISKFYKEVLNHPEYYNAIKTTVKDTLHSPDGIVKLLVEHVCRSDDKVYTHDWDVTIFVEKGRIITQPLSFDNYGNPIK